MIEIDKILEKYKWLNFIQNDIWKAYNLGREDVYKEDKLKEVM